MIYTKLMTEFIVYSSKTQKSLWEFSRNVNGKFIACEDNS